MYKIQFNGCITPILLIAFFVFLLFKLWYLVVILVLAIFIINSIAKINANIEMRNKEKDINYKPDVGEVYKICSYCGINIKRSVSKCPNCGREN